MNWKYENGRLYSVDDTNELLAETAYVLKNGVADILHTYVSPALRGRGVADQMLSAAAEYFREKGIKVTASCSYAKAWLDRHRDLYCDIIASPDDDTGLSCRIDGKR